MNFLSTSESHFASSGKSRIRKYDEKATINVNRPSEAEISLRRGEPVTRGLHIHPFSSTKLQSSFRSGIRTRCPKTLYNTPGTCTAVS